MSHATSVIDLNLYRKRKQAQQAGRLLWAFYAQQAGFAVQPERAVTYFSKTPRLA